MRDFRLPVALGLIVSFSLSGCSTAPAERSAASEPPAEAEKAESRTAAAEPEKKPAPTAEKPSVAAAPASSERPAASSATRADDANSTARLIAQLNDATREIATLRASNAKLRAAGPQPAAASAPAREPDPADAKLAASFRSYAQFKQELAGFFADLDKLRAENSALNAKLKDVASGSQDVKATLAKLESELRAEKSARVQAEQTTAKLREQLRAVAAVVTSPGLSLDKTPSDSAPTARLETSEARLRGASAATARKHTVKDGETLERIADRYYGDSTRWRAILEANRGRLPLDGTMPTGLELEIPPK